MDRTPSNRITRRSAPDAGAIHGTNIDASAGYLAK
jgi:hypothetical protein